MNLKMYLILRNAKTNPRQNSALDNTSRTVLMMSFTGILDVPERRESSFIVTILLPLL